MEVKVQDLMTSSGVKFGTSGARGLADDMTDFVCYVYTRGFLQHLESVGEINKGGTEVAIAGDLRPSTDRIMEAVRRAAAEMGYTPINCGKVPSPAAALYGIVNRVPAIMVTGSHIPADRNGIKFNKAAGEILKSDEAGIREQVVSLDESLFTDAKSFASPLDEQWPLSDAAGKMYVDRYLDVFPGDCLKGRRIGVYQHSAVGRDIILEIAKGLGAEAVALGRSDTFIPVDTEAIRAEDVELAAKWATEDSYDAIISTDGDSDRPLIADEKGRWLRGDVAGILCAKYLAADSVSTPVSCNTAVEKSGYFRNVSRTRIGSPYVIASMIEAVESGAKVAVGYEANGGFLTNSDIRLFGKTLRALPTRDAAILHLSIMLLAATEGKKLSELVADLPERYTASDRLKNFPQEDSKSILSMFDSGDEEKDRARAADVFGGLCGNCRGIDRTDGVRMTFDNDEVIHLRPSGNAPEFRCYTEAAAEDRAVELNSACMKILTALKQNAGRK
ncbi:MAG: phosphomannomutase [Planctomycetes bacterium B3_Pla]|nr:MAG: phosphomannomutase [Planctomycetes bacterium B3_Pla]